MAPARQTFESRMAHLGRAALSLGAELRQLQRDYGHLEGEQLLDFAACLVDEAFHSDTPVRDVAVITRTLQEVPVMPKPKLMQ